MVGGAGSIVAETVLASGVMAAVAARGVDKVVLVSVVGVLVATDSVVEFDSCVVSCV